MGADRRTIERVLALVPQAPPFRFLDDIVALEETHITGNCRYPKEAWFYRGHFPDNPITPGAILVETMAQTGVVALGIYLLMRAGRTEEELRSVVTLFSFIENVDFYHIVRPEEKVLIEAERIYFRRSSLKVRTRMKQEDGTVVCTGVLAGMGVAVADGIKAVPRAIPA